MSLSTCSLCLANALIILLEISRSNQMIRHHDLDFDKLPFDCYEQYHYKYLEHRCYIVAFIVEFFALLWLWKYFMISVYEEAYMCNTIQIAQKECHLFNKSLQESKQYLQEPARKCYKS